MSKTTPLPLSANNKAYIDNINGGIHPEFKAILTQFISDCKTEANVDLIIFSATRTTKRQAELKKAKGKYAAKPGYSLHEYGLAVDVYTDKVHEKSWWKYLKCKVIANRLGMTWGGGFLGIGSGETHHFQLDFGTSSSDRIYFIKAKKEGKTDLKGFVDIQYVMYLAHKKTNYSVSQSVNPKANLTNQQQVAIQPSNPYQIVQKNEKTKIYSLLGAGIWGITKLVLDEEVAGRMVNDSTIAFDQGSLYNYVKKICQEPFVEFMGDTYMDMYYFIVRKPPFNRSSYMTLPTTDIEEKDVYSDNFSWETESYSWYQLIPSTYLVNQNQIYQYLSAVFFEEYAEVWGSKPLSISTNYIEWMNASRDVIMIDKAIEDLKFLIDIHSYLPFTRKGTIRVVHNRTYRRGQRIWYKPTNEYFYVDAVSQHFSSSNGNVDRFTTLTVSRGMKKDFVDVEIEDENTLSYFNLINFGDYENNQLYKKNEKQISNKSFICHFDKDKDDLSATDQSSIIALNQVVKDMAKFKFLNITCYGHTDSDESYAYNLDLSKRRAERIKSILVAYFKRDFGGDISNRIKTEAFGEKSPLNNNVGEQEMALNRRVQIKFDDVNRDVTTTKSPNEGNWKVNQEVFKFFLQRKEFSQTNKQF